MYKIKCPVCKGTNTVKNGKRNGVQLYICRDCPYQFRNRIEVYGDKLWSDYQDRKQTISELADAHGISQSTVKRRLREVEREWVQPALSGSGFVHLDTTYWGHNWGVLLAIDEVAGSPLYVAFINHEKVPFNLEFAVLFLMELLPSRAPLRFKLRGKSTKIFRFVHPAI